MYSPRVCRPCVRVWLKNALCCGVAPVVVIVAAAAACTRQSPSAVADCMDLAPGKQGKGSTVAERGLIFVSGSVL